MHDNENQEVTTLRMFKIYLPKFLKATGKMGIFFAAVVAVAALITFGASSDVDSVIALIIKTAIAWLVLSVIYAAIVLYTLNRSKSYMSIYYRKGYCPEYVDEYKRVEIDEKSNPTVYAKMVLASVYMYLDMIDQAEMIYSSINYGMLNTKAEKRLFYSDRMALYLYQYRTQEAYDIYNEAMLFMDEVFKKNSPYRIAWDDNYLELLFQQRKYDEAMQYLESVLTPRYAKEQNTMAFLYMTAACGSIINGHFDKATEYELMALRAIESFDKFQLSWQKQAMIDRVTFRLERAKEYIKCLKAVKGVGAQQ